MSTGAPQTNGVVITGDTTFNVTGANSNGAIASSGNVAVLGTSGSATTDVLTLTGASDYTGTTTVGDGTAGHAVTFTANGANLFSAASATTVTANSVLDLGGFRQTINSFTLAGGTIRDGTIQDGTPLTNGTINLQAGTVSAALVGGFDYVYKTTAGTVTLSGANTYNGETFVSAGTLQISGAGALGNGSLYMNGGTLDLGGTTQEQGGVSLTGGMIQNGRLYADSGFNLEAGTVSAVLLGMGEVSKSTSGTVTLSGANSYSGGTYVSGGTLQISGAGTLGYVRNTVDVTGGTLDLGGTTQTQNGGLLLMGGTIQDGTLSSNGVFDLEAGAVGAALAGSAGVEIYAQQRPGTVTLSGPNTYTGGTEVDGSRTFAETLRISGAGTLGAITNSLEVDIGTVDLGGTKQTQNGGLEMYVGTIEDGTLSSSGVFQLQAGTIGAALAGSAAVQIKDLNGKGTVTLSGANTYTGGTAVTEDALRISGAGTLGAITNSLVVYEGTVDLGGTSQTQNGGVELAGGAIQDGTLSSSGTFDLQSGAAGAALTGSGSVSKTTTGAVTLSGVNTYTGATTINDGTLTETVANGFSARSLTTVNGPGVLDLGGMAQTINNVTLSGGAIKNGALTSSGGIASYGGLVSSISGTTGLTANAGATTLNADAYTGSTTIKSGATLIAGANAYSSGSALTINGGGRAILSSETIDANVINYGTIDLRQGTSTTNNLNIAGTYNGGPGSVVDINLNSANGATGQRADILKIGGVTSGPINLQISSVNNSQSILSQPVPVVVASGAPDIQLHYASTIPLVTYVIVADPNNATNHEYDVFAQLNGPTLGGVAGGVSSAVGAAGSGFFQGATAFLGSPPNQSANFVNMGVWTREAEGTNIENSTTAIRSGGVSYSAGVTATSHFSGEQVGSDFAIYNLGNTGWNLHAGITGGEYQVGSNSSGGDSTYFHVPFLGVYGAVTNQGFNANLLLRHDFWEGSVNSPLANLNAATMNGSGNAVTAEAGYQFALGGGWSVGPSAGFSYNRVTFDKLAPSLSPATQTILAIGPVTSELGHIGLTTSYGTQAANWALIPKLDVSLWHEFAGDVSGKFVSSGGGAPESSLYSLDTSRIGTFGQIGLGLQGSPLRLPNLALNVRADFRSGDNIKGGTLTFGARYSF